MEEKHEIIAPGQIVMSVDGEEITGENWVLSQEGVQKYLAWIEQEMDKAMPSLDEAGKEKVFASAASFVGLMCAVGFDRELEDDPTGQSAKALVKGALKKHYDTLSGAKAKSGLLMTQELDKYIDSRIRELLETPPKADKVVELIERGKDARQINSIMVGSDAVTKAIFENAIKYDDQPINISGEAEGRKGTQVYASILGDKLRHGDRLIAHTMDELSQKGHAIIWLQTLHNYLTNAGAYKRLSPTDREYYKKRIEVMRKNDLKVDITEAIGQFEGLDELPTVKEPGGEKWNHKTRTISVIDYLLPVTYIKLGDQEGYVFRYRPWIVQFSEKIKQQQMIGLDILKITGKTPTIYHDILMYLIDRLRQINGPRALKNSRIIACKTIYRKMGLERLKSTATKKQRDKQNRDQQIIRDTVERALDHLKTEGAIHDYEKVVRGRAVYSYNILEKPKKAEEEAGAGK